ncbi:MAG TPA: baseplate J/gp47 family protein [Rhodanobacteraceae bacterium]|nr:baseplate J/gp47 family protein [Rhodanobacteraceae bacterium]
MTATSVPAIQWTPNGLVLPTDAAILAGVQSDQQLAFGGNLSLSLSSPQGQLAQSQAAIISDKNAQIAEIVNQVDPANAAGVMQDAIGAIYFMKRIAASGTLVAGTCNGLAGTVIPAGAIAQDTAGNQYALLSAVTIASSGSIVGQFQCLTPGPIACEVGTLTTIYKAISGWESVTNATAGVPGVNEESRADFEARRQNSVGVNALNSIQSVLAAVLAVPNVIDAYVTDNSTNATVNTGPTNYPIIGNSIYVAVAGGAAADVAKAIWSKKSLGCAYNGNTTYTYTDSSTGVLPYPAYTVKWEAPTSVPVYFAVSIVNNTSVPSNITQLVQDAILAAFNGQDGGSRARIASTLYAGRYFAGISAIGNGVELLSIGIGTAPSPTATSLAMGIDQLPTLSADNITVTLS